MLVELRLHFGGRRRPAGRRRARPLASHGKGALRQRAGGARVGPPRRAPAPSREAHAPEGRSRSRLEAYWLGRSARRDRGGAQALGQRIGERIRRLHHCHGRRHLDAGRLSLGRAPASCLRQPQRGDCHRTLQLSPGLCLRPHVRRGHSHAGPRPFRLYPALGLQSKHDLARTWNARGRCQGARGQARGRRSAPRGIRRQGGPVAARATGKRRRAGAGSRRRDDRGELVRPRFHARLDQRAVVGARRHGPFPERRGPERGRRCGPARGLGWGAWSPGALRPRDESLRASRRRSRALGPL